MNVYKFIRFGKSTCNLPGCKKKLEEVIVNPPGEIIFYFCCNEHKKRFKKMWNTIEKYRNEYKEKKHVYQKTYNGELQKKYRQRIGFF